MPLFDRNPLSDGTALLPARWAQEGSVIVNVTGGWIPGAPTYNDTLHTVTSGKVLYVTDITFQVTQSTGGAFADQIVIRDGTGLPNLVQISFEHYTGGEFITYNFQTPIKFVTSVYATTIGGNTQAAIITVSGWEEDA